MPLPTRSNKASPYNSKWQKARLEFLKANPFCVMHLKRNERVKADVVDHIIPHRGDDKLFWNKRNWQALCFRCHNSVKKAQEMSPDAGCDVNGLPRSAAHHWNRK